MADILAMVPRQVVTSEPPRTAVSGADVAAPYAEFAQAMDKTAVGTEQVASAFAERAGAESVTRAPDGSIQVAHPPILGPAGEAYARAMKFAVMSDADGDFKRNDIAIRQQHPNDPEGYRVAADAYKQKTVSDIQAAAGPEVAHAVGNAIETTTTYAYRSMVTQHQEQIAHRFNQSTQAAIEMKTQDLTDLISSGGAGTPQARSLAADIHTLMQERVSNPVLGEPQEVADLKTRELNEKISAAGATYRVNQILKGQSPYQGMIDAAATKYGQNPILIARLINQESGGNPNVAPSAKGAKGLAQFTDRTAAQYGVDVTSAGSSIEGAAHYVSDLTQQFGGNTGLALAAYNWGPKNVAAWMAAGGNPQAMPAETRNYVKSITGRSIEDWSAGRGASVADIQGMGAGTPTHNVTQALAAVQALRDDQSVSPTQRALNSNAGLKAIKDFQEANSKAITLAAQQQKQTDEGFEKAVVEDSASANPSITPYQIKTMPGVSAESKMRMLAWVNREGAGEPAAALSDRATADLFHRIHLPEGDPQKIKDMGPIRDAYAPSDGTRPLLRRTDEQFLEKTLNEVQIPRGETLLDNRREFFKRYATTIDPSIITTGAPSAAGNQQMYLAEKDAMRQEEILRAAGKDPAALYDPRSPDFFGKPDNLGKYTKSLQDKLHEPSAAAAGPAPVSYEEIPANMSPAEVMAKYKPGTKIKLPDGRIGTVPWPTIPIRQ